MTKSLYELMQMAVDIVASSPHTSNKISACLVGEDLSGKPFAVARTNFWPEAIVRDIGQDIKIGNSSGTVHAETACILAVAGEVGTRTKGAQVFITDPPCPNCVKNIAEAGIAEIYIDHKGFDKDWAKRRGEDFDSMALQICKEAGISVAKIHRKEQRVEPILEVAADYQPPLEKPFHLQVLDDSDWDFAALVQGRADVYGAEPFAAAIAYGVDRKPFFLSAEAHLVIGYTEDNASQPEGKYTYMIEPMNRLIMTAARKGMVLDAAHIYSSRIPSARELVNMVGAGLQEITVAHKDQSRDEWGLQALQQLEAAGILTVK
ncbi:MAG: deoxycytidylate deaminase [Pseudomonadota bacterium]